MLIRCTPRWVYVGPNNVIRWLLCLLAPRQYTTIMVGMYISNRQAQNTKRVIVDKKIYNVIIFRLLESLCFMSALCQNCRYKRGKVCDQ